jgi:acyl-CoA dehydrogenase
MLSTLDTLLTSPPTPKVVDLPSWQAWSLTQDISHPLSRAILSGFAADRMGWAFAGGYQAAGRQLLGSLPEEEVFALCATEHRGGHPNTIETHLHGGRLTGAKTFVTMGPHATLLLVVASTGRDHRGRNQLKVALVSPDAAGVRLEAGPTLPFVPEVPHGSAHFEDVTPELVLDGDGYTDYLKPFRTIEDVHVHAALLGYLVQVGRRNAWPPEQIEALLVIISALSPLSASPHRPGVHRVLGGVLAQSSVLLEHLGTLPMEPDVRARWERDQPLLRIAASARATRLQRAREA